MAQKVQITCCGATFAVMNTVNGQNQLVLAYDTDSSDLSWIMSTGDNFTLMVPDSNPAMYLNYTGNENQPVVLGPKDNVLSYWNCSSPVNGGYAVRPVSDTNQNLNAFGSAVVNAVIGTWGWGGGDKNEVWNFPSVTVTE